MPTSQVLQYSAIAVKLYSVGAVFSESGQPTQRRPGGCNRRGVRVTSTSPRGEQPVNIIHLRAGDNVEPTAADLAAIEREDEVISAGLSLLDAEIAYINAGPAATALDRRRIRRAEARVLGAERSLANREIIATDGAA
nr:DUF6284 family protein [Kribbella italica]